MRADDPRRREMRPVSLKAEGIMLVEMRTYQITAGKVAEFLGI